MRRMAMLPVLLSSWVALAQVGGRPEGRGRPADYRDTGYGGWDWGALWWAAVAVIAVALFAWAIRTRQKQRPPSSPV